MLTTLPCCSISFMNTVALHEPFVKLFSGFAIVPIIRYSHLNFVGIYSYYPIGFWLLPFVFRPCSIFSFSLFYSKPNQQKTSDFINKISRISLKHPLPISLIFRHKKSRTSSPEVSLSKKLSVVFCLPTPSIIQLYFRNLLFKFIKIQTGYPLIF